MGHSGPQTLSRIVVSLLAVFRLISTAGASGGTLSGNVIAVLDGETIEILDQARVQRRVRLQAIYAPEKRQAFGMVSREHLACLIFSRVVTVKFQKQQSLGHRDVKPTMIHTYVLNR
ncbi:MAG: hypothetical protein HY650_00500 [Acidobacteria bacterium]|nr:hypothetical protein [Acidobacteriota bacterium]